MKRICFISVLLAALGFAPTSTAQQNANRLTVPLSDPSRPALVKVHQAVGDITVRAYDGKEVIVESRANEVLGPFGPPDSNVQGLHRIGGGQVPSIEQENNVVSVGGDRMLPGNINLQVPRKTNLSLTAVNGRITIETVDGEIEANNTNGEITLNDVSGSIVAHSVNGRLAGSVKRATADKPMAFTSFNGGVDITLPPGIKANVKMRSDNGEVYTDFDIRLNSSTATSGDSRTGRGTSRIEANKNLVGTINGGGPDIDIRTFNGSVYLRKGK